MWWIDVGFTAFFAFMGGMGIQSVLSTYRADRKRKKENRESESKKLYYRLESLERRQSSLSEDVCNMYRALEKKRGKGK